MTDEPTREGERIEADLRMDAKAFRENSIWNSEGDEIRLTKTADRLEAAANYVAAAALRTRTGMERAAEIVKSMADEREKERKSLADPLCELGREITTRVVILRQAEGAIRREAGQ